MANTESLKARHGVQDHPGDQQQGKELSPLDRRIYKLGLMEPEFARAMPDGYSADQLIRDAQTALRNVPDLVKCTEASFFGALMTAAQLGLRPNVPSLGHGWVLPFRDNSGDRPVYKATWILGYQGMIELSHRTDKIMSLSTHVIYANEPHRIVFGSAESIEHTPIFNKAQRGEPVLAYAQVWYANGGYAFHVMGEDDLNEIKRNSKGANSKSSPWNTNFWSMGMKSCIRQLFKMMPKTAALALAIDSDDVVREDTSPTGLGSDAEHMTATPATPAEAADAVPAEPDPEPGQQRARRKQPKSTARDAALKALTEKHAGNPAGFATVMRYATGTADAAELPNPETWTTDEIRAALAYLPPQPTDEPDEPDEDGPSEEEAAAMAAEQQRIAEAAQRDRRQ